MRIRPVGGFLFVIVSLICLAQVSDSDLPAFHKLAPVNGTKLPAVMTRAQLTEEGYASPVQVYSYKAAALKPSLMYQLPCYCHCDRAHGHTSLHSCFESTHGANCGTCMAEALYAYKMSKKGWTTKAIREGIIRSDWRLMDLQNPEPVN